VSTETLEKRWKRGIPGKARMRAGESGQAHFLWREKINNLLSWFLEILRNKNTGEVRPEGRRERIENWY